MRPGWIFAAALLGFALLPLAAGAQVYQWTDATGGVHFTSRLSEVPPAQRDEAEQAARAPSRVQTFASPAPSSSSRSSHARTRGRATEHRIPFVRRGSMAIVHVRLNDRVTAPFVVDTGASDIAIPAGVADAAGIVVGARTPRQTYLTANGPVSSPVVTLDAIEVGDVRLSGVRAHVASEMQIGLLGGSFFNNFTFQIDPAANVIALFPNDRVRQGQTEQQWRNRFAVVHQRIETLDRYLENHFTNEARVAELERNRRRLASDLQELEAEADAADVPHGWRQ